MRILSFSWAHLQIYIQDKKWEYSEYLIPTVRTTYIDIWIDDKKNIETGMSVHFTYNYIILVLSKKTLLKSNENK